MCRIPDWSEINMLIIPICNASMAGKLHIRVVDIKNIHMHNM